MEEQTSTPKKKWINTKRGQGFVVGFILPIACNLAILLWAPIQENYMYYLLGVVMTCILFFVFAQAALKRFGFEGFDASEKNSFGKSSNYLSFFGGVAFSFVVVFIAFMVVAFIQTMFFR